VSEYLLNTAHEHKSAILTECTELLT
jgi:hypothetical protein